MSTPQRKSNKKSSTTFKDSTNQAVIHVGETKDTKSKVQSSSGTKVECATRFSFLL